MVRENVRFPARHMDRAREAEDSREANRRHKLFGLHAWNDVVFGPGCERRRHQFDGAMNTCNCTFPNKLGNPSGGKTSKWSQWNPMLIRPAKLGLSFVLCAAGFFAAILLTYTTGAATLAPGNFRSKVVRWEDAPSHTADWGEMRRYFTGESFGTRKLSCKRPIWLT